MIPSSDDPIFKVSIREWRSTNVHTVFPLSVLFVCFEPFASLLLSPLSLSRVLFSLQMKIVVGV
ncbi:hypothetical protein COLO4_07036 [Corchorus olitorius]|uniref:Uncharacterized protein n=1 Tax=Corchorus olitorius TaxID=93759 RepID=A0A1R3KL41_9ROSI|nr:hypothetical protein COLO4_07036 [Corchorus olitorius]